MPRRRALQRHDVKLLRKRAHRYVRRLGLAYKACRTSRGLSLETAASLAGLAPAELHAFEEGRADPPAASLIVLGYYLGGASLAIFRSVERKLASTRAKRLAARKSTPGARPTGSRRINSRKT
jgi:hypothetical protein